MTKLQFLTSIEAKPNFIKWASAENIVEQVGGINKIRRDAFVTTPDGFRNIVQVWYMEDTADGSTTFQTVDTLEPTENLFAKKDLALRNYLKTTFFAFFVTRSDLDNNWAEADVFTDGASLTTSKVLVYKKGANPITHKVIA